MSSLPGSDTSWSHHATDAHDPTTEDEKDVLVRHPQPITFAVWQLHCCRHISIVPLLVSCVCSVVACMTPNAALRKTYLADAIGAAMGSMALHENFRILILGPSDPERFFQRMQRIGPTIIGIEMTTVLLQTPPLPDEIDVAWQIHGTIKLICLIGLVAPVLLYRRTWAYLTTNAFAAVAFLHFHWSWAGVNGWLYTHSFGLLIGYALTQLHQELYEKERELAAGRAEQARLLEALSESNERREFEIRLLTKEANMTRLSPLVRRSEADMFSESVISHHTAKLESPLGISVAHRGLTTRKLDYAPKADEPPAAARRWRIRLTRRGRW